MNFGEREEIVALAKNRLGAIKKKHPKAMLLDTNEVRVIFLVTEDPQQYHSFAVASQTSFGMTRKMALKKLVRPLMNLTKTATG
jgi:formate dehydrogenase iron-sulfur subunit